MKENKSKSSNVPRKSARSAGIYACATLYASPYVVATDKGYTKHYYVESERTASRIGGGGLSDIKRPVRQHQAVSRKVEANSEMTGRVFSDCLGTRHYKAQRVLNTLYEWRDSLKPEDDGYWYHPDHLGSSSWITYSDGSAVQHLHYLPWGEDLVNQRSTTWNAMYTFSAKEKDTETGYSYFGARYYNSDLSIWLSVDPMAGKYPSLSPYVYCADNPVKLVDPNGEEISEHIDKYGNIIAHYDDGDNSVYLHKSGTTNADISQQRIALHNTGGEGKKVGELGGTIDMMSFFENKLSQSASESKKMSIFSYYMKVKLNGDWDLKNNEKTIWGVAWKYDSDNNTNTTFSCSRFSGANAADVGNYHAGYVGTIANIPRYILCKGAGAAETWKSFKEKRYKDTAKGTIQFLNPFDLRSGDQKKDFWYNSIGMEAAKSERK